MTCQPTTAAAAVKGGGGGGGNSGLGGGGGLNGGPVGAGAGLVVTGLPLWARRRRPADSASGAPKGGPAASSQRRHG